MLAMAAVLGASGTLSASADDSQLENAYPATTSDTAQAAAACAYRSEGDYVHLSSTGNAASGHGWWTNVSCGSSTATVTVQLQQLIAGRWTNTGSKGSSVVFSGGGSANRAVGRANCGSATTTSWRSIVDVDVSGYIDPDNTLITTVRSLPCRA